MSNIQDLENSIDIVELVKRYTNLKKAWTNYKALCPFPGHTEKTPSFVVSPSKQIAHCFGCHRWWGPIKFVMDAENCNFKDAIEILSNITWVKIKWVDIEKEKQKNNVYSIFRDITNYYKNWLQNNPKILEYLINRWITQEYIAIFDFGYADSWLELYNYLKSKWYDDNLISLSNIFLDLKTKKDKFIWRVIFPIKNPRWDIVAFAWRIIDHWEPKYLNSPASDIYDKSAILYWLFEWRNEIYKKNYIIITEWYMDAISLHQAWYKNTVCVSGTAFTEKHIQIIKKLTKRIYLCFDGDKAWQNATDLAIEMLKNKDLEIKIITLTWGKDPDEVIKSWVDFNIFINNAITPIWYTISKLWDIDNLSDKKELLNKLLVIVKSFYDNVERDYYLKEISKKLDIKLEIVYYEYNKTKSWNNNITQIKPKFTITSEDLLISRIIKYKDKLEFIKKELDYEIIKKYFSPLLSQIISSSWEIDDLDLETKEKYKSLQNMDEMLEMKAWIETNVVKNEDKIEKDIISNIKKFKMDLYKNIEKQLKDGISAWNIEFLEDYKYFLKNLK